MGIEFYSKHPCVSSRMLFGYVFQNTLFSGSLLSYESKIYPSLIQKPNMTEQSQLKRNLGEKFLEC